MGLNIVIMIAGALFIGGLGLLSVQADRNARKAKMIKMRGFVIKESKRKEDQSAAKKTSAEMAQQGSIDREEEDQFAAFGSRTR
jgi:hypothetical protein